MVWFACVHEFVCVCVSVYVVRCYAWDVHHLQTKYQTESSLMNTLHCIAYSIDRNMLQPSFPPPHSIWLHSKLHSWHILCTIRLSNNDIKMIANILDASSRACIWMTKANIFVISAALRPLNVFLYHEPHPSPAFYTALCVFSKFYTYLLIAKLRNSHELLRTLNVPQTFQADPAPLLNEMFEVKQSDAMRREI